MIVFETGKVTTTGTMTEDGTILIEDAKTQIKVSKVDVADGKELEGAKIQILDSKGNVVEEWTSTKEAHVVEGLKTGETYTLHETVAPEGYEITADATFTIDKDGKVTSTGTISKDGILLVEDAKKAGPTPTQTVTPTPARTPKTGDDSPIGNLMWMLLLAMAGITAAGTGIYRRKQRR